MRKRDPSGSFLSSPPDGLACRIQACFGTSLAQVGPWPSCLELCPQSADACSGAPKSSCVLRGRRTFSVQAILSKIVSGCLRSENG